MLIIPAIDLKDGCVVRYVQGKRDKKVYSRDPVKTAKYWIKQGADLIHVVDLDGAFDGQPKNLAFVEKIVKDTGANIEFGGGVRSAILIKKLLNLGVKRVIVGTRVAQDEKFLKEIAKNFKNKVIVSLDAQGERLMIKGWKEASKGLKVIDFALRLKALGFKEVIYTDTLKDGTLKGPNIKDLKKLLKETGLLVIASGGVSSLEDLRKLKVLEKDGITGVIIGKALYEGKFTLAQALKV